MASEVEATVVTASATATVMQSAPREDYDVMLTQTQTQQVPPMLRRDEGVHARFLGLSEPGFTFDWKNDSKEVRIGRHPSCEIQISDKRVSGFHLKIYRDDSFHFFVEELSTNGCWINNHFMKKGATKSLLHGDEISIGVLLDEETNEPLKPIASYVFKVAEHSSDAPANDSPIPVEMVVERREASNTTSTTQDPSTTCDVQLAGRGKSHHVSEQWVRDHWDTRTVLGRGNFSEVSLGVHVQGGDKRAVKIIDKKKFLAFQAKRDSQLSLSSEADVLVSLRHSGIVGFIEWFETDAHLYLIMELLEGGDLLQCILEHGHFTETLARRTFRELCEAVAYLHANSVVHRDLKPENVLLTTKDRDRMHLKIADFGLARKTMKSRDCKTFCGTPHYFAPEVIHTFRDKETTPAAGYDKQADVWSLGVILYIMLSGIPPFEDDGLYEQILEGNYEFDVQEWTIVSPEAKELVKGLMTVNPKDRLTIEQALEHRWFRFAGPGSCSSPKRKPPPAFSESIADPHQKQPAQAEPDSKRRRTSDDATMHDARISEMTDKQK